MAPHALLQPFVVVAVAGQEIKVGCLRLQDALGLLNDIFGDREGNRHDPVRVPVQQVAGLDGQAADRYRDIQVDVDAVSMRDDRARAKEMEPWRTPAECPESRGSPDRSPDRPPPSFCNAEQNISPARQLRIRSAPMYWTARTVGLGAASTMSITSCRRIALSSPALVVSCVAVTAKPTIGLWSGN